MPHRLAKHHGLGNDFLVLFTDEVVDGDGWAARARAWCERHRGIGADGLILGSPGADGADLTMTLHNADGSVAEISGNGLRCLAQAEIRRRAHVGGDLVVATGAGRRRAAVHPGRSPREAWVEVTMGSAGPGPEPDRPVELPTGADGHAVLADAPRCAVDLGNPHLVVRVDDPAAVDVAAVGPAFEAAYDHGMNVHLLAPAGQDEVTVVHWERGVGVTEACGSGACAAAVAAHRWGLVGERVVAHLPGGDVEVALGGPEIVLGGPAVHIADVEVDD